MKNKALFIDAIKTLLYSWGSDTPSEATWAANELLDFYEAETGHIMGVRLAEAGVAPFEERGISYIDNFDTIEQRILYEVA